MLAEYPDVRLIVFHTRRQAERYLETLAEELGKEEQDGVE